MARDASRRSSRPPTASGPRTSDRSDRDSRCQSDTPVDSDHSCVDLYRSVDSKSASENASLRAPLREPESNSRALNAPNPFLSPMSRISIVSWPRAAFQRSSRPSASCRRILYSPFLPMRTFFEPSMTSETMSIASRARLRGLMKRLKSRFLKQSPYPLFCDMYIRRPMG